jgi:hypothetical protein
MKMNNIEALAADMITRGHTLHSTMDSTTAARPAANVANATGIPTNIPRP